MKNRFGILLAASLVVLVSLACALPSLGSNSAPDGQIGNDIVAEDQTGIDSGVLFRDDFSDTNSGWDHYSDTDGTTDYENGVYRINVNVTQQDYWANPGKNFTDVRVEVDATKVGGPDDNDIGLLCRYKSVDDFYFFIVTSDGYYGIGKTVGGEMQMIGQESMDTSEEINLGLDTNHIRADCIGSQLSLYVNGTLLTTVTDSDFASGDVGLMAGTYDTAGTDIHFDNFVVYDPAIKK
jgi:hypothetical protein